MSAWRVGRRNPHNVYVQWGDEPRGMNEADGDTSVGYFRLPGDAEIAVAAVNALPPADLPATLATVDDVRQVCEAAELVRDGEHWRDDRVIVTAITTSCMPLAPDDDRDMVGIFVDTAPKSNWRADLNTNMQGWLLWHCIQAARSAS